MVEQFQWLNDMLRDVTWKSTLFIILIVVVLVVLALIEVWYSKKVR